MYFLVLFELELLNTFISKDLSILLTYLIPKLEGKKPNLQKNPIQSITCVYRLSFLLKHFISISY